jgi:hypothetical protein
LASWLRPAHANGDVQILRSCFVGLPGFLAAQYLLVFDRIKPVAITVIRMASFMFGSITAPKMMLASDPLCAG